MDPSGSAKRLSSEGRKGRNLIKTTLETERFHVRICSKTKLTWLQAHFGGSHPGHFSSGARMFSFGSVNIHPAHDHDLKCDMTQPCDVCWRNCSFCSAFHLALANTGIGSKELRVRPSLHCVLAATTRNSWSTSGTALIDVETASWTWWVFLWKTLELCRWHGFPRQLHQSVPGKKRIQKCAERKPLHWKCPSSLGVPSWWTNQKKPETWPSCASGQSAFHSLPERSAQSDGLMFWLEFCSKVGFPPILLHFFSSIAKIFFARVAGVCNAGPVANRIHFLRKHQMLRLSSNALLGVHNALHTEGRTGTWIPGLKLKCRVLEVRSPYNNIYVYTCCTCKVFHSTMMIVR